jgi:hypothetical protein
LEQLTGLTENASAYSTQDIQQMREAQRADIEAQFGAQRQQLEEELARRGISASSIAAGQLGDLAGQQARAIATAEAGLTEKAAESLQRGRETAIQGLAQAAGIQIESKGLDLQSKKVQADIDAEAKRLMQQDRSLDLQSARDQAQNRIAIGQLREQAAGRISRERLTMAQMQQDASQFADRLGLDRDRLESDITTRQRQLEQADERLSSEESRFIATQQAEAEQLAERQRQFDAKMGFDTSQANFQNMLSAIQMAAFLSGTLEPSDLSAEQLNQITSAAGGSPRFTGGGRGPDDRGFE